MGRKVSIKKYLSGTCLVAKWFRIHNSASEDASLIPDLGTKIPHAVQHCKKKNKAQFINKKIVSPVQQLMI